MKYKHKFKPRDSNQYWKYKILHDFNGCNWAIAF